MELKMIDGGQGCGVLGEQLQGRRSHSVALSVSLWRGRS